MAFDELVPLSNITLEIKSYDRPRHSLFGSCIRGYVDYWVQSPAMKGERSWRPGEQTHRLGTCKIGPSEPEYLQVRPIQKFAYKPKEVG